MNGVHDMGGMHGYGPIPLPHDSVVFHSAWEAKVFALASAGGGLRLWNTDMSRYQQECVPPWIYTRISYYERWLLAQEALHLQAGTLTAEELAQGTALTPKPDGLEPLRPENAIDFCKTRRSFVRESGKPGRFKAGDAVRCKRIAPVGHTRLPRYLMGAVGTVLEAHGPYAFADTRGSNAGDDPQELYTVRFDGRMLWGEDGHPNDRVIADLFDDYLEMP